MKQVPGPWVETHGESSSLRDAFAQTSFQYSMDFFILGSLCNTYSLTLSLSAQNP